MSPTMAVSPVLVAQPASIEHKPQDVDSGLSSSPRPASSFATDFTHPILEEGDETASDSPNEPVTPVSGRQSQDFHALHSHDAASETSSQVPLADSTTIAPFTAVRTEPIPVKAPLILNTAATPPPTAPAEDTAIPPATPSAADSDPALTPLSRRSTRGSTSSFKRTMSSLFRRSNSQSDKAAFGLSDQAPTATSDPNLQEIRPKEPPSRRWSMNKSSTTTRSNTPPSPGSPLEMATKPHGTATPTVPNTDDFYAKKSNRASTGFSLRGRVVGFAGGNGTQASSDSKRARPVRRRASSFDYSKQTPKPETPAPDPNTGAIHIDRSFWGLPAEAGTGVKARRMSLCLPDDFTVDVAELLAEFEYQHKFLGRHGKHVGKGATSKVTLMARKGCPGELYAVKEFRGKSSSETTEEYEKKIKSEFSIAKSLHHPNVVETVRLCTGHGRWNHVMEYCSEGDLFSLVQKGYLKKDDREKDRLCLFKQLVQGLNYLHSNGIAHRDIKLENLLITKDSKLKITDFGVSEVFSGIHPGLREAGGQCGKKMGEIRLCSPGICGSEPYIAPEVLSKQGPYDPRPLDVWSSAIVMIHLIFGGAMWVRAQDTPSNSHYSSLIKGWKKWDAKHESTTEGITDVDYPSVSAFDKFVKPPALRRVLLQMLNPDPAKRISMNEVINNRWIKNVECCQLESYDDPTKMIDASKRSCTKLGTKKIFCHNHLPPVAHNTHSLGKMPGSTGY